MYMKKLLSKTSDMVLYVIFHICKAFILWYMYRNEMPGLPDVETWLSL